MICFHFIVILANMRANINSDNDIELNESYTKLLIGYHFRIHHPVVSVKDLTVLISICHYASHVTSSYLPLLRGNAQEITLII